jgi:hypothetical protein
MESFSLINSLSLAGLDANVNGFVWENPIQTQPKKKNTIYDLILLI